MFKNEWKFCVWLIIWQSGFVRNAWKCVSFINLQCWRRCEKTEAWQLSVWRNGWNLDWCSCTCLWPRQLHTFLHYHCLHVSLWGGRASTTASKPKYWPNKICGCLPHFFHYLYIFKINLLTLISYHVSYIFYLFLSWSNSFFFFFINCSGVRSSYTNPSQCISFTDCPLYCCPSLPMSARKGIY